MSAAVSNPKWARPSELLRMAHLLVLAIGLNCELSSFKLLVNRITLIQTRSGTKFLVLYLKECIRLVLGFLNHSSYTKPQKGVQVSVGKSGLPLIIPARLRFFIARFRDAGNFHDRTVLRIVLSILSFYRVLQFKALPDLSTITGAFTGVSASFAPAELRSVLTMFKLKVTGDLSWTISEAAGPNGPKATWFSGCDAIALMFHPKQWMSLIGFGIVSRKVSLVSWLLVIQILAIPIIPLLLLCRVEIPSTIGRLVCLTEGGGKRRIIAITDWWTQILFKPLHDGLFYQLRKIGQDGTFHQFRPIETWVLPHVRLGAPAYSFDLSAATDRLPIEFQRQVLSILIGPVYAWLWVIVLDRKWMFNKAPVRYSVGQPIGAYSSWGMLAFCHHVLVQLAASRAGVVGWFPYYAIVGDDIVIADKAVADSYQILLRTLGLQISLSKSLISESGLLEFAKRWTSATRGEISAIAPALLLQTLRSPHLLAVLIVTLFERSWITFPEQLRVLSVGARKILKIPRTLFALIIATVIGPSGLLRNSHLVTAFAESWFTTITKGQKGSAVGLIIEAFRRLVEKDIADCAETARVNFDYFTKTWWRRRLLRGPSLVAGILSIPLMLVSPGFYMYWYAFYKALKSGYSASLNLAGMVNPDLLHEPGSIQFDLLGLEDLASIDWSRRRKVRDQFAQTQALIKELESVIRTEVHDSPSLALVPVIGDLEIEEEWESGFDPFPFLDNPRARIYKF